MKKKAYFWQQRPSQKQLLVALLVIVFVGTIIYWRNYSANPPEPLFSDASGINDPAHWSFNSLPFGLQVINHGSSYWTRALGTNAQKWEDTGIVDYTIVPAGQANICEIYPEAINFCTWSGDDGWLSQMMYLQGPNNEHITAAVIAMNDFYFNSPGSMYNNSLWKNYTMCNSFGWTLGIPWRLETGAKRPTCMNPYATLDNIGSLQNPDQKDISRLQSLYNHTHDTSSTSRSYIVQEANKYWQAKDFGVLQKTSEDGSQTFSKDLGNGYRMITESKSIAR